MGHISDLLINTRMIQKLNENMLRHICLEYDLALIEATIISFLHNNPERDTAADIVELKMLQKSNVSQAVETLYRKGYLVRKQDTADRRKIHLSLTEKVQPIIATMEIHWAQFEEEIYSGISKEEKEIYIRVNEKMKENIQDTMKRRGQK